MTSLDRLFVYGTLRRTSDAPMAQWLHANARWIATGQVAGRLYALDGYPGLIVDDGPARVTGDLFAMSEPLSMLPLLDDYEECTARFRQPHEYWRVRVAVATDRGTVEAWTYIYAWSVEGLLPIANGDFLA